MEIRVDKREREWELCKNGKEIKSLCAQKDTDHLVHISEMAHAEVCIIFSKNITNDFKIRKEKSLISHAVTVIEMFSSRSCKSESWPVLPVSNLGPKAVVHNRIREACSKGKFLCLTPESWTGKVCGWAGGREWGAWESALPICIFTSTYEWFGFGDHTLRNTAFLLRSRGQSFCASLCGEEQVPLVFRPLPFSLPWALCSFRQCPDSCDDFSLWLLPCQDLFSE